MKKFTLLIGCMVILFFGYSQKIIEGSSKPTRFKIEPTYDRGLPPNLFVELNFQDDNGNGILESEEKANLKLTISNKGKGRAQGLEVLINDNVDDDDFFIGGNRKIYFIGPDESADVIIPIEAGFDIKTAEHKLKIDVKEHFGYDMDPAFLVLNTLEHQKSKIVFSGLEIVDYGEGTGAIVEDGQLQAGEMVRVKLVVQNVGQNVAKNAKFFLKTLDENIFIQHIEGDLGDIAVGEVKEFWVTVSPNKRITTKEELPIYVSLKEELGYGDLEDFQLPIVLNQKPPVTHTLNVQADLDKFKQQVARFEYTSNKFTTNLGNLKNIADVLPSKTSRLNSVAVVLGIENYKDLPPAPYADNDATIIEKYFKNRLGVDQVVVFKNEEISGLKFDDIFNPDYGQLQKSILKGETELFVFYSGHGVPSKNGDNIYLFPSDGKVERIEIQGYDLNKFYQHLEGLGAKSVTVFIDACFSGASRTTEKIATENLVATKGLRIEPRLVGPWLKNPNFTVFNSSGAQETSLGFDLSKTGLFTYFLCVGMQGDADLNDDRKITNGELFDFVCSKVKETSKKIFGIQTPQFRGNREAILIEL